MQVGDIVIAARAGIVRTAIDHYPDDGYSFNWVNIEHADGTVAFYAHLMQNSIIVSLGDSVRQGQYFAKSSRSGSPWFPHLHFGVYQNYPPIHGLDTPVNFRNAEGPLDECGGLVRGAVYKATSIY
jgi:murein DD-endopeptidase MepM/ murein hydrolase activator NlpD